MTRSPSDRLTMSRSRPPASKVLSAGVRLRLRPPGTRAGRNRPAKYRIPGAGLAGVVGGRTCGHPPSGDRRVLTDEQIEIHLHNELSMTTVERLAASGGRTRRPHDAISASQYYDHEEF